MESSRALAGEVAEVTSVAPFVRAATGADQLWLADAAVADGAVRAACALVARCTGESVDAVLDLPVGARAVLLWELRRSTEGDGLDAVVECEHCGEKLDLELSVPDLVDVVDHANAFGRDSDQRTIDVDGRAVTFRLPTGRDQVGVAAEVDPARALCRRIVVAVDGQGSDSLDDPTIGALIDPLGDAVAATDPAADTVVTTVCPACGGAITATLDAFGYLCDELLHGVHGLLGEVHVIASNYHWSEADILALPLARRRAYLDLIAGGEAS